MKKGTKKQSFTVGFRLDDFHLSALEILATRHNVSLHEEARRIVIDALNDAERGAIKEEVSATRQDIKGLRMALANAVEALLITAGDLPQDKARVDDY